VGGRLSRKRGFPDKLKWRNSRAEMNDKQVFQERSECFAVISGEGGRVNRVRQRAKLEMEVEAVEWTADI